MFSFGYLRPLGHVRTARPMTTTPDDEAPTSVTWQPARVVVELVPEAVVAILGYSLPIRPDFGPRRKR
jgi:hypothetical protein